MTTIILTIIGILLAAAAALMVIFYGGDSFNASDSKARANELVNMANNISAAQTLYKAENGRYASGISELSQTNSSGVSYLKAPLPNAVRFGDEFIFDTISGRPLFAIIATYAPICSQVNKVMKQSSQPFPSAANISTIKRIGCTEGHYGGEEGYFYALS